jgi:cobalt/nickel transport system permease protein
VCYFIDIDNTIGALLHIPDGYISPQTSGLFYLVSIPLLGLSTRIVRSRLKAGKVPLLALLAAFSFLIMMFNVPLPGGTTGHATGGVLVAILVGPLPAMLALTLALAVQALFFGDGGILSLGANIFNLGFVMPVVGYLVFRMIAGRSGSSSRRFSLAAAIGGYVGINAAAALVALELGIQPALHHLADGTPLYCPFPLSVTIPAMVIPHLAVGGLVEALVTGGVAAFLGTYHPELFDARKAGGPEEKG